MIRLKWEAGEKAFRSAVFQFMGNAETGLLFFEWTDRDVSIHQELKNGKSVYR